MRSGSSSNRNSSNFNSSHGMVEIRKFPSLDWLDIYCFDSYCLFQNFVLSLVQCSRDSRMHVKRISEKEFSFGGLKVTSWYICILQFKQLNMHSCDYQTMYKPLNSESCCLQISMRKTFPQVSTYLYSILTTHSCILLQLNRFLSSLCIYSIHILYILCRWSLGVVISSHQYTTSLTSITVITHSLLLSFINPSAYSISLHHLLLSLFYSILSTYCICILRWWFPFRLIAAIHSAEFHFYSRLFSFLLLLRLHLPPSTSSPPPNPVQVSSLLFCSIVVFSVS